MQHQKVQIHTDNGDIVTAQAPIIVSASRATDIPAFYCKWFFDRLKKGYAVWRNPFNGQPSYISFANMRFIVFWSKNPAPLLPYLERLRKNGIGSYIQYTLNDYVSENFEPNLPSLDERIATFQKMVDILGAGSVVWRFDPLILSDSVSIDTLLDKISHIADRLAGYTNKLVFSFADIASYKKVGRNLEAAGVNYREWDESTMIEFASRLSQLNNKRWGFQLATCSEAIPLDNFGIAKNRCIDPDLIARLSNDDDVLLNFLASAKTDKGQRKLCGCILSKDIGSYNTCPHGCVYCYANTSPFSANQNFLKHQSNPFLESII